ncbi:hypothetical protein Q7F05_00410 [Pseudomonas sp. Lb2C1-1]|uniref:hypothetical protein n=1 Tax=Pseudomonas TaxID=286 RepID=UPI00391AD8CF
MKKTVGYTLIALSLICTSVHAKEVPEVKTEWSSRCAIGTKPELQSLVGGAVLAIVAPIVIGMAVDAAGAAVEASANTSTVARISPPIYASLYDVDKTSLTELRVGCLTIIKGIFEVKDTNNNGKLETVLREPHMFMEVAIAKVAGQPLYQLKPVYLKVNKFEDSSFWTKERRLDVAITLQGVSTEKPFASAIFSFPNLREGATLLQGNPTLLNNIGEPFPLPELADAENTKKTFAKDARKLALAMSYIDDQGKTSDYPLEDDKTTAFASSANKTLLINYCKNLKEGELDSICTNWRYQTNERKALLSALSTAENSAVLQSYRVTWAKKICPGYRKGEDVKRCVDGAGIKPSGYFSTKTTVTMVRDANKFGMAVASALTKSSPKMAELSSQYLPAARETAGDKADEGIAIALQNERAALSALDEAQTEEKPQSEINTAKLNLLIAMSKTNDAYRAAGRGPIHTSL